MTNAAKNKLVPKKLDLLVKEAKRLKLSTEGDVPALEALLTKHYEDRYGADNLMECDGCEMAAPEDYKACVGCGHPFDDVADPEPEKVVPIDKAAKSAKAKAAKGPKVSKQEADKAAAEAKAAAPAEPDAVAAETVARLADLEKKIDAYKVESAVVHWDLGVALREIRDNDLWRAAEGKFKSYGEYVEERHKITRRYAAELIDTSAKFTREQAKDTSITILKIAARAPEGERDSTLENARANGTSAAELTSQVKAARAQKGLRSERRGLEGTVMLTSRLKYGKITSGEWQKIRDIRSARFVIGEAVFQLKDLGRKGWELQLTKLKPDGAEEE